MTRNMVVLTVGTSASLASRLRGANLEDPDYFLLEVATEAEALTILRCVQPTVIMVNTGLERCGSLSLADYVAYRYPDTRVIFEMSSGSWFSDGSLFTHSSNVHAMVTPGMPPEDINALVAHHATMRMSA